MKVEYQLHVRAGGTRPAPPRPRLRRPYRVQFRSSDGAGLRLLRDWWSVGSYGTVGEARQALAEKRRTPMWASMDARMWDAAAKAVVQ